MNFANQMLPQEIRYLWEKYGFGEYADGLLKVVDPRDYMDNLYKWLGGIDYNMVPIMVSAFGDIFYYRKEQDDISVLDLHYAQTKVCSQPYTDFFKDFMMDNELNDMYLRRDLFNNAVEKLGKLNYNEAYFFVPAIKIGGFEDISSVQKGSCNTHQSLLFSFKQNENEIMNKFANNNSIFIINKVFPMSDGLTPVLGNVLKGSFVNGDQITVYNSNNESYQGEIARVDGSEPGKTVEGEERVIIFLNGITSDQVESLDLLNRNAIVK